MDGFVTKRARVKEQHAAAAPRVVVVVPRSRPSPVAELPKPSVSAASCPAVVEEEDELVPVEVELEVVEDDRDDVFNEYWSSSAPKRERVREKRKKLEAAPRTIREHFGRK